MAYTEHITDYPTCTSIPHAIFNCQIVYCPHDQGYTLSMTLGDTGERPWSGTVTRYGPFDTVMDVAHDLAQYLKVVGRRQLLEAALTVHTDDEGSPLT